MAAPVHPYSDYGIALQTLRSARNWLGILLFICVLLQVVGFLLMRFTRQPFVASRPVIRAPLTHRVRPQPFSATTVSGQSRATAGGTGVNSLDDLNTASARQFRISRWTVQTKAGRELNLRSQWETTYYLTVPVTQLLGLLAAASQAILIFLTLIMILVAQAPGVAHLTRSLNWAVILLFMVLPWQYFFHGFPIPGVLYSWHELLHTMGLVYLLPPGRGIPFVPRLLIVARYVGWPMLAMVVMLVTAERFRAGTRLAIGHPLQSMMSSGAIATGAMRPNTGVTGSPGVGPQSPSTPPRSGLKL